MVGSRRPGATAARASWPGFAPDGHIGFVRVFSGRNGAILYQFEPDAGDTGFGRAVASAGDADGDGQPDIIVGSYGHARVYSGRDGRLLRHFVGTHFNFGRAVAGAGDLDGDGRGDVIVGEASISVGSAADVPVRVYSVRNGELLLAFPPHGIDTNLGSSVAGGQDFDGDGVPDIVAGADHQSAVVYRDGAVWVVSGADGSVLHGFIGLGQAQYFGGSVDTVGDMDGDGVAEILGGTLSCCGQATYTRVWSGATGRLLHHVPNHARVVSGLGDVDGDGVPDFTSWMSVFSGATAEVIRAYGAGDFERPIRAAGDVDADGWPDIVRKRVVAFSPFTPKNVQVESVVGFTPVGSVGTAGAGCAPGAALPMLPTLQVTGSPANGQSIAISVVGVGPGTTTLLVVGPVGELPMANGCTLLIAPPFELLPVPVGGEHWGWMSLRLELPGNVAALVPELHLQAATLDRSIFLGYSMSNRVTVTFDE